LKDVRKTLFLPLPYWGPPYRIIEHSAPGFLTEAVGVLRSESRNDILDSDHSLYDTHSAAAAAAVYYQPAQYTGFVRTCDGKFIRNVGNGTEFESLFIIHSNYFSSTT
jgi:hypothetical protein